MIKYTIYNDDSIRKFYGFESYKNPYCLEDTLFKIVSMAEMKATGIPYTGLNDPRLLDKHFVYYTTSNYYSWGELPFRYIYNDMVRHIQNTNTDTNFNFTMESIYMDKDSVYRTYGINLDSNYIPYEIVTAYITENYLNSYMYMRNNNNGVLTVYIPEEDGGLTAYIIGVGFNPYDMAKWFCTKQNVNDVNALPYTRYMSLVGIVGMKLGLNRISLNAGLDLNVYHECAEGKKREDIRACVQLVDSYKLDGLKRKSELDTEVKYGNFDIDYNILGIYDIAQPATMFTYVDKDNSTFFLNKFNQYEDYRIDYRLLKHENNMIKIDEKRKDMQR